jgi:hypothetical protein
MLYAGIDIHKSVFQAVVLDRETGELSECRFAPSRQRLGEWASELSRPVEISPSGAG